MTKLKDTFKKITTNDLDLFQKSISQKLPHEYKDFLITNNGGRPKKNIFKTLYGQYETDIQFFFGLTEGVYDLKANYKDFSTRFDKNFLPIAISSGGDLIILNLNNENVLYLDSDIQKFFLIDESFQSFIDSLYEISIEETEFDIAIREQNLDYFKNRLAVGEKIQNVKNEFNQSLTLVSSLFNKLKVLKFAIEKGADPKGALFNASANGHKEIVKYLLDIGMDPNERDSSQNNDTALIQACAGGHLEVVKILINHGADINATDDFNQTALNKAYWSDNNELIEYLESIT